MRCVLYWFSYVFFWILRVLGFLMIGSCEFLCFDLGLALRVGGLLLGMRSLCLHVEIGF